MKEQYLFGVDSNKLLYSKTSAEKRFIIKPSSIIDDVTVIIDNDKQYSFPVLDSTLNYMFCKVMNELFDENKELKSCFKTSEESVEALRSINNNLEKENKQLKKENKKLLYEITEYKQAEYDNYNITDGLW